MKMLTIIAALGWTGLWLTPDQLGGNRFQQQEFASAAKSFQDPMWQGCSWYRAGEFKKASAAFARVDTPAGHYNRGNTLVMLGKYQDAVAQYNMALEARPGWRVAVENRNLAAARAEALESGGGDMGQQEIGADEIKFDKKKDSGGEETEVTARQATSDKGVQAMWLRRIQTRPADFLKSKFAYQQAYQESRTTGDVD